MGTASEAKDLNILALIPARGGSKRIPNKNLWPIRGVPLLSYTLRHCLNSKHITHVYVSTDDEKIASVAKEEGADVVMRPAQLADDMATSESALVHALDELEAQGVAEPDIVVFLQCTSPVRKPDDLDKAIEQFLAEEADTMFSACRNYRFIWAKRDGKLESITYDYKTRQRSQDFETQYVENGSFFLFRPDHLRKTNNRLGGKISVFEMDLRSSFEIDDIEDIDFISQVMGRKEYLLEPSRPAKISLVVFDFDGVLTDNSVLVAEDGKEAVFCNRADGLGLDFLRKAKVPTIILSTEKNSVVSARAKKLQIECHQGIDDKAEYLRGLLNERNINPEDVIYVGNDMNDIGCLELVGFPVVVGDAHAQVMGAAKLILNSHGGKGAVRELCDLLEEWGVGKPDGK